MQAEQAWQAVVGQLQMEMPKATFDTWVRDATLLRYEQGTFTIGLQNAYARDWMETRLSATINRSLSGILNREANVNFIVTNSMMDSVQEKHSEQGLGDSTRSFAGMAEFETPVHRPNNNTLAPKYTFDSFVVGNSNRLAHAACQAVAENPARAYNPLFLYGGVGLGKTHLLHAIGNKVTEQGKTVLYVSSEEFTNDLINAIRSHTTQAFREKYRLIDVLLIDDIQFISGKESTQEEFFHTFNTLHGQDKQIVISSDRPPKAMNTLEERLRSRFEWGLAADIQAPDYETRLAILRFKADRLGKFVPNDIMEMIARRMQSNIRELEGALTRLLAYSDLRGMPLSSELVQMALGDMITRQREVRPDRILDAVSRHYGIPLDRIMGRERSRQIAFPRQVAMYLMREEANISLPQIGEAMGGRDHTTVMYACSKIADLLERDHRIRRQVLDIRQELYST